MSSRAADLAINQDVFLLQTVRFMLLAEQVPNRREFFTTVIWDAL